MEDADRALARLHRLMEDADRALARLHRQLHDVEQQHRDAKRTAEKIRNAAQHREQYVAAQIERLRPTALTHPEDGDRYQAMIAERARLHQMLLI